LQNSGLKLHCTGSYTLHSPYSLDIICVKRKEGDKEGEGGKRREKDRQGM